MMENRIADEIVLIQVQRYRMMIPRALAAACAHDLTPTAAKIILRRLASSNMLGTAPLYRRQECFYLAEGASRRLVDTPCQGRPQEIHYGALSEVAKVRAFAFLTFFCLGNTRRERLTLADMHSRFPRLARLGQPQGYYVDLSNHKPVLGFLHVDVGGPSRWDRIVHVVRQDVIRHLQRPEFQQLIQEGQFEMAVATALPQKADRIRTALKDFKTPEQLAIRVAAMPELLHLVAPPPR